MKYLTTLVLAVLSLNSLAESASEISQCAKINTDSQRLACYDRLSGRIEIPNPVIKPSDSAEQKPLVISTPQPTKKVVAPTPVIAPKVQAETKAQDKTQEILAENQRNEFGKPVDHKDSLDKIDVRIQGTFKGWDKGLVVTLENGQKWRVVSNSRGYTKLSSPKAVIERAFFGSYKMRVEGYTPVAKVKRVK